MLKIHHLSLVCARSAGHGVPLREMQKPLTFLVNILFSASTVCNHHNGSATAGLGIEVLFSSTHTTVGWPRPWVEIVNGAAADAVEDIGMRRIRKRTYLSTSKAPQILGGVAAASTCSIAAPISCGVNTDYSQNSFLSDAQHGG